jgi:hypothetical protein
MAAPVDHPQWRALLAAPAFPVRDLLRVHLPDSPGVYLWRRDGLDAYVGKASNLRRRVWGSHLGRGVSLAGSSVRRNVCELLFDIPPTVTGGRSRQKVTRDQAHAVREWLAECELSWQECASPADALELEIALRKSHLPPLNRI